MTIVLYSRILGRAGRHESLPLRRSRFSFVGAQRALPTWTGCIRPLREWPIDYLGSFWNTRAGTRPAPTVKLEFVIRTDLGPLYWAQQA